MNRKPLCSVLIPSRARFPRLLKTIRSLYETASTPDNVEVVIRLDDDDRDSLSQVDKLSDCTVMIGPRDGGYASLTDFYMQLSDRATGRWIWIMNDDAYLDTADKYRHPLHGPPPSNERRPWDIQLAALDHNDGIICQVELYKLGLSGYWHAGGAFPMVPNRAWERVGRPAMETPVDTWLHVVLHQQHGWRIHELSNVAVIHERDDDEALTKHRAR